MHEYQKNGLQIVIHDESQSTVIVVYRGESCDPSTQFLDEVTERVLELVGTRAIEIDFRRLEYINSISMAPLLSLFKRLSIRGLDGTVYYTVEVSWQRVGLNNMRRAIQTLTGLRFIDRPLEGK